MPEECDPLSGAEAKAPKTPAERLYELARPWAGAVRVSIQMVIGAVLVLYVFYFAFNFVFLRDIDNHLIYKNLLGIIGYGLVLSAAIDLAYMLFTPNLDEAVEPLIVALSAGAILLLSEGTRPGPEAVWAAPAAIFLMVASIATLFWVKKNFLGDDERERV
jgi:hypothetical protein